jgi:glyoxylase-like metal-dependent hydrolase (beta-lactamase superfamily II)
MQISVVLIAAGALSMTVAAYQQPQGGPAGQPAPRVVEVEKLKDNLFVLRGQGGGGNTAVFVMANGVAVVDTKNPGWGQPILDKIKELTPKPVTLIINTHTHGDHVSGNVEFPATVDIVVHENTAALMKQMNPVAGFAAPAKPTPNIFEENKGRGLPKRTFKDQMTIGTGPDQIDLHYFGRGHTNGDAWVLFPALRVVHAGDIFASNTGLPLLDTNNGGSGVAIPDTLMKAHGALSKSADTIITGHSVQMTFNDLRAWADWNRGFLNDVVAAEKAGRNAEDFAKTWKAPASWPAPPNEQAAATAMKRLVANAQAIMAETK